MSPRPSDLKAKGKFNEIRIECVRNDASTNLFQMTSVRFHTVKCIKRYIFYIFLECNKMKNCPLSHSLYIDVMLLFWCVLHLHHSLGTSCGVPFDLEFVAHFHMFARLTTDSIEIMAQIIPIIVFFFAKKF